MAGKVIGARYDDAANALKRLLEYMPGSDGMVGKLGVIDPTKRSHAPVEGVHIGASDEFYARLEHFDRQMAYQARVIGAHVLHQHSAIASAVKTMAETDNLFADRAKEFLAQLDAMAAASASAGANAGAAVGRAQIGTSIAHDDAGTSSLGVMG